MLEEKKKCDMILHYITLYYIQSIYIYKQVKTPSLQNVKCSSREGFWSLKPDKMGSNFKSIHTSGRSKINANLKEWRELEDLYQFPDPFLGKMSLLHTSQTQKATLSLIILSHPLLPTHYSDKVFLNVMSFTKDLERKQRRGLHCSSRNILKYNSRDHNS